MTVVCVGMLANAALCRDLDAQGAPPPDSTAPALSLADALAVALHHNPDYLKAADGRRTASANVLSAYGQFLPSVSASFGVGYQQGGSTLFQGAQLGASSSLVTSNYSLGLGLNLSGSTFIGPSAARASREAVDADITGQRQTLRTAVTDQYLTTLEADARAALQDTLLATARAQLDLAKGKAGVGTGTLLEVQQAQVTLGQKEVAQLQAYNQAAIERLKLFQQMGVPAPSAASTTRLTTAFTVEPFPMPLDSVLAIARRENPPLTALRSRERASQFNVTLARSRYTPSLSIGTGIGGYTSQYTDPNFLVQQAIVGAQSARTACDSTQAFRASLGLSTNYAQCDAYAVTPGQIATIRRQNRTFPFGFTQTPHSLTAGLSLPIFDGFAREASVEQALVGRNAARYDVRARELQLTTDVSTAYLTMQTAERTATLRAQTAEQAHTALTFMQQRYKVGLATFVDVAVARDTYESAENDRITSVYDYFKAVSDLEGAVGHPLRSSTAR